MALLDLLQVPLPIVQVLSCRFFKCLLGKNAFPHAAESGCIISVQCSVCDHSDQTFCVHCLQHAMSLVLQLAAPGRHNALQSAVVAQPKKDTARRIVCTPPSRASNSSKFCTGKNAAPPHTELVLTRYCSVLSLASRQYQALKTGINRYGSLAFKGGGCHHTPSARCVRPGLLAATAGRLLKCGCYCSAAGVLLACVLEGSGFQVVRALTSSAQPSSSQRRNVCTNLQPPCT